MRELNKEAWDILEARSLGEINNNRVQEYFGEKASSDDLKHLLEQAKEKNSSSEMIQLLLYLPKDITEYEKVAIYRKCLLENWHELHEEIAGFFQTSFHNDRKNIDILKMALDKIPSYLQPEDFRYPYIRKIIYAIGAQPEPYNLIALQEIAVAGDDKTKALALHQIEKRKSLGRWEAKRNGE